MGLLAGHPKAAAKGGKLASIPFRRALAQDGRPLYGLQVNWGGERI